MVAALILARSYPTLPFNAARWNEFDKGARDIHSHRRPRWSESRRVEAGRGGGISSLLSSDGKRCIAPFHLDNEAFTTRTGGPRYSTRPCQSCFREIPRAHHRFMQLGLHCPDCVLRNTRMRVGIDIAPVSPRARNISFFFFFFF